MSLESPAAQRFLEAWNRKTLKQVEKELASMRKFVQRNSSHYAWHGANVSPGGMADGDKILILEEIAKSKREALPA